MDEKQATDLSGEDRLLLVKVPKAAEQAAEDAELYELARKWWRAAPTQVEKVRRVLGVHANQVVAAYEPTHWEVSTDPDTEGRVAFHGAVAADVDRWVGLDVSGLFPPGASNPVRYTTVATLRPEAAEPTETDLLPASRGSTGEPLVLLLRLNQSWYDGIRPEELYDVTRHWWVMSPTKAERVIRVLAVAEGKVREAYEPLAWSPSPVPGEEHRIGFDGHVADDRDRWVGMDVSSVFPQGSQNPVRYVAAEDLGLTTKRGPAVPFEQAPLEAREVRAGEPDLAELVNPLLQALEADLMWSMSRGAQELFHSNTLASLMAQHPVAAAPLRALFEGAEPIGELEVWREWRHIDLVARRVDSRTRFVVENKLYSIPYAKQLELYAKKPLPWSEGHGPRGAADTSYILLSLMDPTFELPPPWRHLSYDQVLRVLEELSSRDFGSDAALVERYCALVRRLVELKDAVDPRQDIEGPFSVQAALGDLHHKTFAGPLQRMRFTGLAQAVVETYGAQLPLKVDLSHAAGSLTYTRALNDSRSIGWQFQEAQLRMFVLVRDRGLVGKGEELAVARARVAEAEYVDFAELTVAEDVLGGLLEPKSFEPGVWRKFAPDFVYRYRKVSPATSTQLLAEALAELTAYVEAW
jgi:hypothetical protein